MLSIARRFWLLALGMLCLAVVLGTSCSAVQVSEQTVAPTATASESMPSQTASALPTSTSQTTVASTPPASATTSPPVTTTPVDMDDAQAIAIASMYVPQNVASFAKIDVSTCVNNDGEKLWGVSYSNIRVTQNELGWSLNYVDPELAGTGPFVRLEIWLDNSGDLYQALAYRNGYPPVTGAGG